MTIHCGLVIKSKSFSFFALFPICEPIVGNDLVLICDKQTRLTTCFSTPISFAIATATTSLRPFVEMESLKTMKNAMVEIVALPTVHSFLRILYVVLFKEIATLPRDVRDLLENVLSIPSDQSLRHVRKQLDSVAELLTTNVMERVPSAKVNKK